MCGVILENKRVTVCFFVCLLVFFFFTKGVVASVWCTSTLKLLPSFNRSKHCNDKMTSIDQKIVYETLSTGILF